MNISRKPETTTGSRLSWPSPLVFLGVLFLSLSWSCAPMQTVRQPDSPGPVPLYANGSLPADSEELTPSETDTTVAVEVHDLDSLGSWEPLPELQAVAEEETEHNFPITMNHQVEYYLDFFQNRNRKTFERWLARSGRYIPLFAAELEEAGLPTDLVYLPMIESGYLLNAYSSAAAVGPWQFMERTAIHFGLTVDNYVDERRDPIKSTQAAVAYLKILYGEFNSWELAVAGYNAGEGRIRQAIKKYGTSNFWKIAEKTFLPPETKLYVPKLIAAILIAKSPEKYGFTNIDYEKPLDFEYAEVPRWTSLDAVKAATNCDFEELRSLNRELRQQVTPPDRDVYTLKVPRGYGEILANNLPRVHGSVTTEIKFHTVQTKDTLSTICKQYNISKTTLLKANNLHKGKIPPGTNLRIPYQETRYVLLSEEEMKHTKIASTTGNITFHKVKSGETVGAISRQYHVSPKLIAEWNDLTDVNTIRAGQQLALYLAASPVTTLVAAEQAKPATKIATLTAGSRKKAVSTPRPPAATTYYQVRDGDSLWKIARQFKLHADDIKRWNNLKTNTITPGLKLLLKLAADA